MPVIDSSFRLSVSTELPWSRDCFRGFRGTNAALVPMSIEDAYTTSHAYIEIGFWYLYGIYDLRKLNADYVRCVHWILRTDIDPEAIGSAIHLASAIRFDATPISNCCLTCFFFFPLLRHALILLEGCTLVWETGRTSHGTAA